MPQAPGAGLAVQGDWLYGGPLDQSWLGRAMRLHTHQLNPVQLSNLKVTSDDNEHNPVPSIATDPVTGVPLTPMNKR